MTITNVVFIVRHDLYWYNNLFATTIIQTTNQSLESFLKSKYIDFYIYHNHLNFIYNTKKTFKKSKPDISIKFKLPALDLKRDKLMH
jgi:hypothetical protein